jgi:ABC-2 type transport system permease protein
VNVRAASAGFMQQARQFIADPQWIIPSLISPFLFTMVMLFIYPDVDGPIVLSAVLGGGVLGMWANTLFASSFSVSYDRMTGTFEEIMSSPTSFYDVLIGRSLWNAFIGLLNAVLVFVIAEIVFQTAISLANPIGFFFLLALTLASLSAIGMVISTAFVMTRRGTFLSTISEFPIYVLCGALIPVSALPSFLAPASYVLAPAWGVDAIKYMALEGYTGMMGVPLWADIVMMVALSAVCLVISWILMKRIEMRVRTTGSAERY